MICNKVIICAFCETGTFVFKETSRGVVIMQKLDFAKIGAKIRQCRINAGYTQEQLSEKLDVNQSHLSNIECGRAHPSLTMLMNLSNILHCNIDAFLDEEYNFEEKSETTDDKIRKELNRLDDLRKEQVLRILQTF